MRNTLSPQSIRVSKHLPGDPVAVIDIGSNSVRLVVYERLCRSLTVLFNEKVLCGLGQGVAQTGKISKKSIAQALSALERFYLICRQIQVNQLSILATAAVREAANGADFLANIKQRLGCEIELLSGKQEAYYSAYGIISGFTQPNGLMGDLGGGSLELIDIKDRQIGSGITLPLGGLRLQSQTKGDFKKVKNTIAEAFSQSTLLSQGRQRSFYAIGGTWRALAKVYMRAQGYPLRVLHHFCIPAEKIRAFCQKLAVSELGLEPGIEMISKARRPLLPYGALVLEHILQASGASDVIISALGVREGYLYQLLHAEERLKDPLLSAAEELCILRARSPAYAFELCRWTDKVFEALGIDESADERRLRQAACLLSDTGWRAHPDYRGEQSLNIIAHAGFIGIDHPGRAYLALAVYYRHAGNGVDELSPKLRKLAGRRHHQRARVLAITIRLAFLISAGMPGIISQTQMKNQDGKLCLGLPDALSKLNGEKLMSRLGQLARTAKLECEIAYH